MDASSIGLQSGVFSRFYSLPGGHCSSVAYHTPSQSVVFFEGDSAEVWWRIFETKDSTVKAYDYILRNGSFDGNRENEAKAVLADFVRSLKSCGLIASTPDECLSRVMDNPVISSTRSAEVSAENPEHSIAQFMADQHILYTLVLELTYKCNEKCVHCYLPEETQPRDLSLKQIDDLMSEFEWMGGLLVQLTGGEPLFRGDIVEILNLCNKHGFVISLTTNLTLLRQDILESLKAVHPRSIGCSIYSARPRLHDAITMVNGSLERSIQSIRLLRDAGIPVVIKSPLMATTAPYWREIEELAINLGCEYQFDLSITAKNDGKLSPTMHRVTDPIVLDDILSSRYYKLFIGDEKMSSLSGPSTDASLCGAGGCGLAVSPNGTIRPCIGLNTPLGKWPEESLQYVWNRSQFFSEFGAIRLLDITPCNTCDDLAFCSRCPGAWLAEHGDFRKPSNYTCFLAQALKKAQSTL